MINILRMMGYILRASSVVNQVSPSMFNDEYFLKRIDMYTAYELRICLALFCGGTTQICVSVYIYIYPQPDNACSYCSKQKATTAFTGQQDKILLHMTYVGTVLRTHA